MILTSLTPVKTLCRLMMLCFSLFLMITACEENEDHPLKSDIDQQDVESISSEEELQTAYDELDLISIEASESIDHDTYPGGREQIDETDRFTRCASVTHDKQAMTITIDFGDGCEGPDGKVRSGIIFITYTGRLFVPGSIWTVTSRGYTVNRKLLEGTKTITNVSESIGGNVSFHKLLEGGKVTWPDGTYATREVDKTITWIRADNPLLDEFHVDGIAKGMTRRGVAYVSTNISTVIWKRACRLQGICIPVQGLKLVERREHPDMLLDFGDGQCDAIVTITKNGQSRVIEKNCRMD